MIALHRMYAAPTLLLGQAQPPGPADLRCFLPKYRTDLRFHADPPAGTVRTAPGKRRLGSKDSHSRVCANARSAPGVRSRKVET